MAAGTLASEAVAWAQVPPPPAATPAGGARIPSQGVAPARTAGRAYLVTRGLSEFYLWFVAVLVVWALAPVAIGMTPVLITSGSMQPHVTSGDVVVISGDVDHPVDTGSVITFRDPAGSGRLITHRVTERHEDGTYQTRGDANATSDSTPVPPDHVEGAGRLLVPSVGLPTLWLRTGELGLFALWAGVTVAALAGAFAPTTPTRQRRRRPGRSAPSGQARRRWPGRSMPRPAWASAAAMSLSTVTVLSLAALSVAAFSGTTATAGDWTAGLAVPQNVGAAVDCGLSTKTVTLTWDDPTDTSNVTDYEIYRSTDEEGPYDNHRGSVAEEDPNEFEDSDVDLLGLDGAHYYVVRSSHDSSGWESVNSDPPAVADC